jgi:transposase
MMSDSFPTDLTDEQWAVVEPLIPRPAGGGRRFWRPSAAAPGSAQVGQLGGKHCRWTSAFLSAWFSMMK